ncbi:MAG: YtxH domain-containing protein [Ignavibacteriales bacterium]|nr:YtxH domain-containing protein [Ignavibacteriales bacterium]
MTNEAKGIGKGLLIGTLTGAAVGSIIALLYAPKSGKNLREEIKTKSHDFLDDVDEYIVKAKDKVSHLMNEGKNKSEKLVAETKEKVDMLLNEAEKLLTEAKDKTGKVANQGKEKYEKESERLKTAIKAGMDV